MSQVTMFLALMSHVTKPYAERPQTLQGLLRMSKITNQGRPLWSQGTGLMT